MCGINVTYSFSSITERDRASIDLMNQEMRYRGPDDQGIWSDEICCLGAVRLAIIGLGNGHQPILNESEDMVLVCNGEIYNYRELKDSLVEKGHRFNTDTDIEVLVHLYEEHGRDFIKQVKGMFAFAIYDQKGKTLVFGRDRLGEKPLYYSQQFGKLIVSSEIKTIAIYGDQEVTVDESVVAEASYSSFPQDPERSLFNEIKRVPPGECITVTQSKFERFRLWNGRRQVTFSATEEDAVIETRRLLEQAVNRTLIADVPIAVMLSGGIDSSGIAAIACRYSLTLEAITVGYEGDSLQDERPIARRMAKDLGIKLHEIELTMADFSEAFEEYTQILDEPIWDPASIMQWHVYKRACKLGFKVLLTGQGSDEFFFGYPTHIESARHHGRLRQLSRYLPVGRRSIKAILRDCARSPREFFDVLKLTTNFESLPKSDKQTDSLGAFFNPRGIFWAYQNGSLDPIEARFNYLREIYLAANGFLQADTLSMANSVEVRSPFADVDLATFLLSIPLRFLVKEGESKSLLRRALKDLLPEWILNMPKKGFQPSDACLDSLVSNYTKGNDGWSVMTKEIATRAIARMIERRINFRG
jgi:asparagine synthase (glutamine-hydrolysing)